ncbi:MULTISPECIES: hypothetical protein [unclassified Sporosarcina]|uniref:hypothetical protein n=1 Tax=unclassified Sporosarcina TaxID=2647733 RepID=UPI00204043DF|nr:MULTISPECIES: hypothetical protein [unclassified Sporosarcina]GKV65478.1 hypothetical protein NCCP2331_16310 [Sporosarcina sp. NCCP-2331]GLB55602.1 hypothetical protein NCCP2378_13890 [Sporosarcina sp. NCCP-2378]
MGNNFEQLINHLDDMLKEENEKLRNMAVNAMSTASGLPFADRAIIESHRSYELMQKRVLGMIDAVEEVKAFSEGYFEKESDK